MTIIDCTSRFFELTAHAAVSNLFNLERHLVKAEHYRNLRVIAFAEWSRAVV
jgi:putative transposase